MSASLDHRQYGAAQRSGGGTRTRHGDAAPSSIDHQFQFRPASSSRRVARFFERHRANCRGFITPAFLFPVGIIDPDAIAEFRIRLAAGLLPEQIAACLSSSMEAGGSVSIRIEPGADQPLSEPGHVVRLSSVDASDVKHRSEELFREVRTALRGL